MKTTKLKIPTIDLEPIDKSALPEKALVLSDVSSRDLFIYTQARGSYVFRVKHGEKEYQLKPFTATGKKEAEQMLIEIRSYYGCYGCGYGE